MTYALIAVRVEAAEFIKRADAWEAAFSSDPETSHPEPELRYSRTVGALEALVDGHPDYPRADEALYLLGWCLLEMGEEAAGLVRFRAALKRWPDGPLAGEMWLRIGEHAFDFGKLADARRAYEEAIPRLEGWLAEVAHYKLAWSHYREDRFADAIRAFLPAAAKPASGRVESLRFEAIQYIAISLTEPWTDAELDVLPSGRRVLARLKKHIPKRHPAAFDIHVATATVLFELVAYDAALAVAERTARHFADSPDRRAEVDVLRRNILRARAR